LKSTIRLNTAKQSGGALWRFANAVAEIQRCYKLTNGAERIDSAPFDPGVAFAWLAEYRKSASRRGESLQVFLSKKLDQWIGGLGGQALFSPQDVKRLKKIVKDFGLMPVEVPSTLFPDKNLTSLEIGRLSPRVSRPPEKIKKAVLPEYQSAFLADGTPIEYQIEVSGKFVPDSVWNKKNQKEKFVFLGKTVAGDLVFGQSGIAEIFTPAEADNLFVPVKTERNPEVFKSPEVKEIIELFGDHFFGPDQIEKAFTIKNEQGQEVKLIDLSPEERQRAVEMLEEKLREPDIKQFLTKPENQKDIKDGKYLLILRVNKIKVNGKNTNLTMKAMQEQIAPDMARNNQGKLLFNTGWYKDEDFYTTATPTFEWTLVTKGVVEATLGKDHPTQTAILTREAQRIGLDPTKIHRRAPCETVFDRILFRTTDFLRDRYDWSDTKSGGLPVGVGGGDSAGLDTSGHSFGNSYSLLGSSLSR
jgi:hypothetical protein